MSEPVGAVAQLAAAGGAVGEEVAFDFSARFAAEATQHLSRRLPSQAPTDPEYGAVSMWVRVGPGTLGTNRQLLSTYAIAGTAEAAFLLNSSDQLVVEEVTSATPSWRLTTSAVLRDVSGWLHIALTWNTSEPVEADRMTLAVNGEEITDFVEETYPALNFPVAFNAANQFHMLGRYGPSAQDYYDGCVGQLVTMDGTRPDLSSLGQFTSSGLWVPRDTSILAFGNNGSYHLFAQSGNIGVDSSGNGNDFTNNNSVENSLDTPYNNLCVLAGATQPPRPPTDNGGAFYDKAPTRAGLGLDNGGDSTSRLSLGTRVFESITNPIYEYTQVTATSEVQFGFSHRNIAHEFDFSVARLQSVRVSNIGNIYINAIYTTNIGAIQNGDTVALGLDYNTKEFVVVKPDDTIERFSWPEMPDEVVPFVYDFPNTSTGQRVHELNFGQSAPVRAWPTIHGSSIMTVSALNDPRQGFEARERAGTGAQNLVALTMGAASASWVKRLDAAGADHQIVDILRGEYEATGQFGMIQPNESAAESVLTAPSDYRVESPGRRIEGNDAAINASGSSYLDLHWRADTGLGIAVIRYTGNGVLGRAIPHNLGRSVRYGMVWVKRLDAVGFWQIGHGYMGSGAGFDFDVWMAFNEAQGRSTDIDAWANTLPDETNVYLGNGFRCNELNGEYVMYVFAPVPGFSAFGWYTGNSNTDGPYIPLGFHPAWFGAKAFQASANWTTVSAALNVRNPADRVLALNVSNGEAAAVAADLGAQSVKVRSSSSGLNTTGSTYIWWAFAKHPGSVARGV